MSLIFGVVFVVLTPPFQVPDEPNHFYRAFQVSEFRPLSLVALNNGQRDGALLPKSLAAFVDSSDLATTRFRPANKVSLSKFLATRHAPLNAHDREYLPVASYPPLGYVPQAVAIGLGRLAGASPLVLFYLARLGALGAWIALVFLAIKTTPVLKWTYCLLALMPMTLYLAASTSVDSVVIGASFLLSAQLLSWAYDRTKDTVSLTDAVYFLILAVVITLSKALYLPLVLLFFLVPTKKFASRTRYVLIFGAIVVACLVAYAGWSLIAGWLTAPGPSIDLSRHGVDASHLPDVSPARQLAFIRSHPWAFVKALLTTIAIPKVLVYYLYSFVGMLGWLDTLLPFWLPYTYLTIVIAVSLLSGSAAPVSWNAKALAIGVFALTGFAGLAFLYVGYSTVGMAVVGGFQGRYLIPAAPLLFLVFHNHQARWRITRTVAAALCVFVVSTTSIAGYSLVKRFYVAERPSFAIEAVTVSPAGDVIVITGWAVDGATHEVAEGVDVEIDGQYFRARYGIDRGDVAQRLERPSSRYSGFEAQIPVAQVGRGRHTLALRVRPREYASYVVPEPKVVLDFK